MNAYYSAIADFGDFLKMLLIATCGADLPERHDGIGERVRYPDIDGLGVNWLNNTNF